jgi:cyclic beta-1,2-glucan synthetase
MLPNQPRESYNNILRLQKLGAEGKYGFYESVDFSKDQNGKIINVYMSHHQGAILFSLANMLFDNYIINCFNNHNMIKALGYLNNEKAVVRGRIRKPGSVIPPIDSKNTNDNSGHGVCESRLFNGAPYFWLLSNGRLTSAISTRGSGFLKSGPIEITHFSYDPTFDNQGHFLYIKDNKSNKVWSCGYKPTMIEPINYDCCFSENYVKISRLENGIKTTLEVVIHPTLNAEVRKLSITNTSQKIRNISLDTYNEISLFSYPEMRSHPNFHKLKIDAEIIPKQGPLILSRTVTAGDTEPSLAYAVVS